MRWYNKVTGDISHIPAFLDYYEAQINEARFECAIKGNLEKQLSAMPGITEYRFNQLQEIDAILEFMDIELRKIQQTEYKKFLEAYNKTLSSRDAEKYAHAEPSVTDYEQLKNQVAFIRNKFNGIMKALEAKNFMMGHITRLRAAGLEDITIS